MSKNLGDLSRRKGLRENLFEELDIAATETGTVPKEKIDELANEFLMGQYLWHCYLLRFSASREPGQKSICMQRQFLPHSRHPG